MLKERIYKFEVHAHNYKLYKDSIGYNYPRVATRDVMPKYAFSRGYGVTTESLIVTYGLIMSKIEPYDPERRTAYEWWMSYMERAMRDNYNFPILEELDPTYAPQTKLELKINAMLKKKDPERFKNLPVYEGDD